MMSRLLDTGATDTCARQDIAPKHSKVIHPVDGVFTLVEERKTIPRIGRTENIELMYGARIVSASLEVISQPYPFIIGMDLFHGLGFSISGLTNPGADVTTLPEPEEDHKPSLIPDQLPAEEKTEDFIKAKKEFMALIENHLRRNADIESISASTGEYCSVQKTIAIRRKTNGFVTMLSP
jgi:hypothetical protein